MEKHLVNCSQNFNFKKIYYNKYKNDNNYEKFKSISYGI